MSQMLPGIAEQYRPRLELQEKNLTLTVLVGAVQLHGKAGSIST